MRKNGKLKYFLELFYIFFYVAVFTVGGGIVMVPLLERILVEKKKYLSDEEFGEIFSVAQVLPGSLILNMATFAGYKIRGFWGAAVSCLAIVLPPLAIITIISIFFTRLLQFVLMKKLMLGILCGVVGEIGGILLKMFRKTKFNTFKIVLFLFSFTLVFYLKVHPVYVVLIGGLAGIFPGRAEV